VCGWETKKKVGLLCLVMKFGFSSFEPPDFNTRGLVTRLICVQKVLSIPLLVMGHFMVLPSSNLKWHVINSCESPITYFSRSFNFKIIS
jgi:hypothetical protein